MKYDYLKKTALVTNTFRQFDGPGYYVHVFYCVWMIYKEGIIKTKLNIFSCPIVKDEKFTINAKEVEYAWEKFKDELEKGEFPEHTYSINYPDDMDIEEFEKTEAYKEEMRKYDEGTIYHKIISIAPIFTIPTHYQDSVHFFYDKDED